jgi:glycosyltransferase involved in cell wall biosynthesis
MRAAKILFVVTEDWYFYSHRLPLAIAAAEAGHDVSVATRLAGSRKSISDTGIRTIPLRFMKRSSLNVFRELASFVELFLLLRRERPDLIHLVALKPVIYGSLAASLAGISARVNALAGLGFVFSSKKNLARFLKPILMRVFRFIFNDTHSKLILQNQDDFSLMTELVGVKYDRVCLIRGAGVNLDQYSPTKLPPGVPIIMLASRMLWDKGVGEFVNAAKALQGQNISARFVLIGDSDSENPTSISGRQLKKWNDSGVIEWWGYRSNMAKLLSQARVVCLPTYYGEGVPKVLIEAMACGRPIVTTDMPGCRDLVKSGRNGILVKPKDSVELAASLMTLILNKSVCQKMGIEGRKTVEKEFSLEHVIEETMAVYKELLIK